MQMELNDRENDLFQALIATTKSAVSVIPGLGQAIAGWDAYHQSRFNRNVKKILEHLNNIHQTFDQLCRITRKYLIIDWFPLRTKSIKSATICIVIPINIQKKIILMNERAARINQNIRLWQIKTPRLNFFLSLRDSLNHLGTDFRYHFIA